MKQIIKLIQASLFFTIVTPATATDSPYGAPNQSNERFADYAFFRGEWEASITIIRPDGTRQEIDAKSRITAFYHGDGQTLQTCFRAPGFFSTSLRAYDSAADLWRAHFLNAQLQRWSGFTIRKVGDTMETLVPGGFSGTEAFDVKTVEQNITETSFTSNVFRRAHGSDTWTQTYEMRYTKLPENPNGPEC